MDLSKRFRRTNKCRAGFYTDKQKLNVDYIPASPIMSGAVTILGLDGDSQNVLSRIFKQPYFQRITIILYSTASLLWICWSPIL